jgi:ABC-type molybdate transport system permease subunit
MKFVIRRAVVAVVAMPLVASAYVLGCALLIGLGAGASFTIAEAWVNGWEIAGAAALVFTFGRQLNAAFDKVGA